MPRHAEKTRLVLASPATQADDHRQRPEVHGLVSKPSRPTRGLNRRDFLAFAGLASIVAACGRSAAPPTPTATSASVAATTPAVVPSIAPQTTSTTTAPAPTTTTTPPPGTTTTIQPITQIGLTIQPRDSWEARDSIRSRLAPHSGSLRHLTVHHAGDQSTLTGPERFRSWQSFHINDRGWGDVAYHYIIGVDGTVYTARDISFRGDTATDYDPDRHFLVVVEGNFNKQQPTETQQTHLAVLLAWAAEAFDIPPSTIRGHRDHATTSCPGDNLYPYVAGNLRVDVETIIAAGGVALS